MIQPWIMDTTQFEQAVYAGDGAAIQRFLAEGGDVNSVFTGGRRALHIAVGLDLDTVCALLLAAGASPDVQDAGGDTPLMLAAFAGNTRIIELLVAAGCDLNLRNCEGMSACSWAEAGSLPEVTALLRSLGAEDPYQRTVLHDLVERACEADTSPAAELDRLLAAGADINAADQFGCTPLMLAAGRGAGALAALLLQRGADPQRTDQEGATALTWALESGDGATIALLSARVDQGPVLPGR